MKEKIKKYKSAKAKVSVTKENAVSYGVGQKGELQIYKSKEGTEVSVILDNNTVCLDAHLIAAIFGVNRPAIVKHISNIYQSRELDRKSTCSILEQVAADGKKRKMNIYNLDINFSWL